MYRKIIVGYRDTDESRDALALAKVLADATAARLIVTGVFPYGPAAPFASAEAIEAARATEEELAGKIEHAAKSVDAEAEGFPSRSPARGLHDAIEELGADLVVVGSSSRAGAGRILAGNVALQLLQGAPCAVAVAPKGYRDQNPGLRVIGVGIDPAGESTEALLAAVELGAASRGTLRLFTAVSPGGADPFGVAHVNWPPAPRQVAQETLDRALERVPDGLRPAANLIEADAVSALADEAGKGVDLLVVGSRGYGPLRRVLLGSVSSGLVRSTPCSVLVVPRGVQSPDPAARQQKVAEGSL